MRAVTPVRFLLGDLEAAREVAASPGPALGVGLLFVASAALAREYDVVDLAREPEHLGLPFLASLGAATVTFALLWLALRNRRDSPRPPGLLARWTALFLWTAPLAWLYAIPWERVLGPADAARANLYTLAVVAAWRVALMVRVGAWLFGGSRWSSAALLLGASAPIVLVGLMQNAAPLIAVMGGVRRMPEGVRAAAELSLDLVPVAMLVCPVLALSGLVALAGRSPPWTPATFEPPARPPRRGALAVALVSVALGLVLLAVGQPEQRRASEVEAAVERGDTDGALRLLADSHAADFPPIWTPPPARARTLEEVGRLLAMVEGSAAGPAWARARYVAALGDLLAGGTRFMRLDGPLARRTLLVVAALTDDEARRMLAEEPRLGDRLEDLADPYLQRLIGEKEPAAARAATREALRAARARLGIAPVASGAP